MKGGFLLFNGKFYRETDPLFTGAEIYRLNMGIRESFRTENNLVMFAGENFNFLINSLLAHGLPIPDEWDLSRFTRDVSRLLNKNHFFLAARVTIQLIPGPSGTDYLLSAEEAPRGFYPVNDGNILIDFFNEGVKPPSNSSAYEPSSRLIWSLATRYAVSNSRNNLIILNSLGFACESIGGSFGYITERYAVFPEPGACGYTPPILGVVMECAAKCGYEVIEKKEISRTDLLGANELFLIDNCLGIRSVLGLGSRRYYNTGTLTLANLLSEVARKEHPSI